MGLCVFKTADVVRCVTHALAAKKFRMPFSTEEPRPALLFVHDQGVYLMSNGLPPDLVTAGSPTAYAAYADQCAPDRDEDWWENSRARVGGDDFGEIIKVDPAWLTRCNDFEELHIEVAHNNLDIFFTKLKKKKVKK